jgi:prevent-host-death family protein
MLTLIPPWAGLARPSRHVRILVRRVKAADGGTWKDIVAMRYSTSDLSRKSGDIIARALQGPVTITQRGKPRLILMSVEEYNRLRGKTQKPTGSDDSN